MTSGRELDSLDYLHDCCNEKYNSVVEKRYWECQQWYIKRAVKYKRLYFLGSIIAGLCPLMITAVEAFDFRDSPMSDFWRIAVIILSLLSGVATFLLSLFWTQEIWISSRRTAEQLKSARVEYLNKLLGEKVSIRKAEKEFLENIEKIIRNENDDWKGIVSQKRK